MSRIVELWRQGEVPGFSGLYRANGSARSVEVDGAALTYFRVGEPFDVAGRLAEDPDHVAEIDESARAALPDGGSVVCGEGALGSQGFFARLDASDGLIWVVYLSNGNPFHELGLDGSRATFTNNHGRSITVDLTDDLYA